MRWWLPPEWLERHSDIPRLQRLPHTNTQRSQNMGKHPSPHREQSEWTKFEYHTKLHEDRECDTQPLGLPVCVIILCGWLHDLFAIAHRVKRDSWGKLERPFYLIVSHSRTKENALSRNERFIFNVCWVMTVYCVQSLGTIRIWNVLNLVEVRQNFKNTVIWNPTLKYVLS